MSTTIILRGFKVPFKVLDGFLLAHNIWETEGLCSGIAPFYNKDPDKTSTLLRNKVGNGDTKTRVFVPYKMSLDHASHGYVAYDWIMVFAQRRIKPSELSEIPPEGFEDLRREILSYSPETNDSLVDNPEYQNGLWVVITDERVYVPPELRQRMLNITCDQCEATFADGEWSERQLHRQEVHGSTEGLQELPEDA